MKPTFFIARCLLAVVLVSAQHAFPQQSDGDGVVLVKLANPVYPPLARQARITGDVKVALTIGIDGAIVSAVVKAGHPILTQAALDSAKQSQFECRTCSEAKTYSLVYTFKLVGPEDCCASTNTIPPTFEPEPQQSGISHVTVTAEPACFCDPATTIVRVRSIKCLYLWRCSSRDY